MSTVERVEDAVAYLRKHTTIPIEDGPCYDPHSGITYPYGLFVPVLGKACGIDAVWIEQVAEDKGWNPVPEKSGRGDSKERGEAENGS